MRYDTTYNYAESYLDVLQSKGVYWFTPDELIKKFHVSPNAIKKALQRLKAKNKMTGIRKGFNIILPPEYHGMGTLPVSLYIDALMKHLKRDYYVGLLSAAALNGAAHQQPQVFFVITLKPPLRDISNKKAAIRFPVKKYWDKADISEKKTDTGYIKVSSPELTALDLIYFQNISGGLNHITTVIHELAEVMDPTKLAEAAKHFGQLATTQRLGYLLDEVLECRDKTEPLFNWLKGTDFFPVFLKAGKKKKNMRTDNRWKVIVNAKPNSDL